MAAPIVLQGPRLIFKDGLIVLENPVNGSVTNIETRVDVTHAQKSKKGGSLEEERKDNSDALVIIQNYSGIENQWLFGVFDGHGVAGHKIAHSVKRSLPTTMNTIIKTNQ